MSTETIVSQCEDQILRLQINRPSKKNALTQDMYRALTAGLREAQADDEIRAVLLLGADDCFSAGNDVMDFMQAPPSGTDSPVYQFLQTLIGFPKPIVAAVRGVAVGIGTTLLMHCDLVYAGESARFQMPFVNLGLCPEAGSSYILPRMMGHVRAAELLLLGETFDGAFAKEVGLINDVCPDADVVDKALQQAARLAQQPPASVRLTKSLLKQAQQSTLQQVLDQEAEHFIARLTSPEAAEAFTAFAERRQPDFSSFK